MIDASRVERLERTVRRQSAAILALVVVLGIGGLSAAMQLPGEIQAKGFILVDDKGKTLASLDQSKLGPIFSMEDRKGDSRILMSVTKEGTAVIGMAGNNGRGGITLSLESDGTGRIEVADPRDKVVFAVP